MLNVLETPVIVIELDIETLPQEVYNIRDANEGAQIESAKKYGDRVIVSFCGAGRNPLFTYTYFET
jgi:hypothetical protein